MSRDLLVAAFTIAAFCCNAFAEKTSDSRAKPNSDGKIPLPGLAVSVGMSVDEVAYQLQNQKFQHVPEKRWQKNGQSFQSHEQIVCSVVPLRELNEQLVDARFIFEKHTLVEIALTIIDIQNAITPLIEKLQLVEIDNKPTNYVGLKGKITMRADRGDAEKMTWIIRRSE